MDTYIVLTLVALILFLLCALLKKFKKSNGEFIFNFSGKLTVGDKEKKSKK